MKILITGASGMLGKDVVDMFSQNSEDDIFGIYRTKEIKLPYEKLRVIHVDITEESEFQKCIIEISPDIIVHCAAMINVDGCENNKEYVQKLHCETTKLLAMSAPRAQLVYISSDSVYDGERGNYSEQDVPNPLNNYARTKFEGEQNALKYSSNAIVVRTNIYGFHLPQMPSLVEFGLENFQKNNSINGFTDVYFNPLYTKQLAEIVKMLVEINFKGIINAGSNTFISKYAFLVKLANVFGYDSGLVKAQSVNSVNFKARRPLNTTLDISLLERTNNSRPDLSAGLSSLYKDYQNAHALI